MDTPLKKQRRLVPKVFIRPVGVPLAPSQAQAPGAGRRNLRANFEAFRRSRHVSRSIGLGVRHILQLRLEAHGGASDLHRPVRKVLACSVPWRDQGASFGSLVGRSCSDHSRRGYAKRRSGDAVSERPSLRGRRVGRDRLLQG